MRKLFGGIAKIRPEHSPAVMHEERPRRGVVRRIARGLPAIAAVLGLASARLHAQEDLAGNLLQYMSAAVRSLDYQGSFIYEHNGEVDALRIFHQGGIRERERLVGLSGARSEILREGDLITCVQADRPTVLFPNRAGSRLLPLVPDTRSRAFGKLYALGLGGEDRVAGYRANIVEILPRDGYRYGYRLWLEQDSKLLLRSAVIDSSRRVLEQFMFVALDIHTKPNAADLAPSVAAGVGAAPEETPLTTPPRWRVTDPPSGFLYLRGQRPMQAPTQAEHYVYSDGIANVSIYIEPRDPKLPAAADSVLTRGVLSIYSRNEGDWKITALGDVPRATVQRMARSVQAVQTTVARP